MDNKNEMIHEEPLNLNTEQLEEVNGGVIHGKNYHVCSFPDPPYKRKSLFGWNWYKKCPKCGNEKVYEYGPWSGSPDDPE